MFNTGVVKKYTQCNDQFVKKVSITFSTSADFLTDNRSLMLNVQVHG